MVANTDNEMFLHLRLSMISRKIRFLEMHLCRRQTKPAWPSSFRRTFFMLPLLPSPGKVEAHVWCGSWILQDNMLPIALIHLRIHVEEELSLLLSILHQNNSQCSFQKSLSKPRFWCAPPGRACQSLQQVEPPTLVYNHIYRLSVDRISQTKNYLAQVFMGVILKA